jgi:hypothetical protein
MFSLLLASLIPSVSWAFNPENVDPASVIFAVHPDVFWAEPYASVESEHEYNAVATRIRSAIITFLRKREVLRQFLKVDSWATYHMSSLFQLSDREFTVIAGAGTSPLQKVAFYVRVARYAYNKLSVAENEEARLLLKALQGPLDCFNKSEHVRNEYNRQEMLKTR